MALARVFYLVLVAALLTATTDPLSLADGLEKLLRPGTRLGTAFSGTLALMLTLALRFVPTMLWKVGGAHNAGLRWPGEPVLKALRLKI